MLYAASIPGVLIAVGMQFAVESLRWLAKVHSDFFSQGVGVTICPSRLFVSESSTSLSCRLEGLRMPEKLWRHFGNLPKLISPWKRSKLL
jgi:hypothetical protein